MNKYYQRAVPGKNKTIKLVFNDPKVKDYYENFAIQFADELFGAVEAGVVDGENSEKVLLHSLEYWGLPKHQVYSLCGLLPYFVVEERTLFFDLDKLKEWLTIPHFQINVPNCLKDGKRLTGVIVGILLLVGMVTYGVLHFMGKKTGAEEMSLDNIIPAQESVQTNTTEPSSRFKDLVVSSNSDPVVTTIAVPTTDSEQTIVEQNNGAFGISEVSDPVITSSASESASDATASANCDAMMTSSAMAIQQVRQLIINDDEAKLKSLFKNGRLLIEVGGFCSDYISEDCANLIQSGKIRLIYDKDSSEKLLRKIIITN